MVKGVETWDCLSILLQTFEEGTPIQQALAVAETDMIQIGLLKIGNNFVVKIGKAYTKLADGVDLQTGIAFVVAYYYILSVQYPLPLKNVFLFFEMLFELPMSKTSVAVTRFLADLA